MIKKVGLIIIAIVTIFNLILPIQTAYAAEPKKESVNEVMGGISNESADSLMNDGKTTANPEGGSSKHKVSPEPSMGGATASAVAKLINIIPTLISSLLNSVVNSQQINSSGTLEFTIQDLLEGKYDMFSIDFFGNVNETEKVTGMLTQSIVVWYSAMRNLAIGITLLVLVYVGIRMAISTVADEKAKYQKMLIAWVKGFCMIFVLIYIIMLAINISNGIVDLVPKSSENLEKTLMYGNIGFGTMNGKDGKPFKTRDGGVMRLEYLLKEIDDEMLNKIKENQKEKENLNIDEAEAEQTAKTVALRHGVVGDLSKSGRHNAVG